MRILGRKRWGMAALLLLVGWLPAAIDLKPARVIRVISGDTLTIQFNGRWEELKLSGIEAPDITMNDKVYEKALENSTTPEEIIRRGTQSHRHLKSLIHYGSQIWIEFDVQTHDRVNRLLGYVYLPSGKMINEIMLRDGFVSLANFPPNLKYQDRFSLALRYAKENQRGFWRPTPILTKKGKRPQL